MKTRKVFGLFILCTFPCVPIHLTAWGNNQPTQKKTHRYYEPTDIVTIQGSRNPKRKRTYLTDQLAIIDSNLQGLENAPMPHRGIAQLEKRIANLKKELGIYTITPELSPAERSNLEKEKIEHEKKMHKKRVQEIKQQFSPKKPRKKGRRRS